MLYIKLSNDEGHQGNDQGHQGIGQGHGGSEQGIKAMTRGTKAMTRGTKTINRGTKVMTEAPRQRPGACIGKCLHEVSDKMGLLLTYELYSVPKYLVATHELVDSTFRHQVGN